ncbi:MAG: secondary thiamine-phosphate synthase enzyme YjbQ [Thermodesulfobacteriota bacterium]|nr:secondary thiamine-phosphate synthase enzyme YjbQ [Thermodesulfobacteriota bacterium]
MEQLGVNTNNRVELVDITPLVRGLVEKSGVEYGVCYIYVPHTTAAVTINESADPSVARDIESELNKLIPFNASFSHMEGNSDAHIKSTLVGCSKTIFIQNGSLFLGTWQGIFFCEFDGPRKRKVYVKIVKG